MRAFAAFQASLKNTVRYTPFLRGLVTRKIISLDFPAVIGIDPTTECNLDCRFCGPRRLGLPRGMLSLDLFTRVIDESLRHGRRQMLILHNSGEPLLNKDIYEMVAIAKARKAARVVQFSTNGVLITERNAEKLVRSGLDGLVISVDASTREDYAELKGRDCLEQVIENARVLMAVKKRLRSRTPYVSAKMVRRRGYEDTFRPFLDFWKKIVDEAALTPYSNWGGAVEYRGTEAIPRQRFACHFLWYYPAINWDGAVYCCCASPAPGAVIGHLDSQTLEEIWKGRPLARLRRCHLEGNYEEIEPCKNCTYWSESGINLDRWLRKKESRREARTR
jgi:radical SAM protein with 4Fe4S-binding SPASM domain